ncbi:TetR/AcrR family transcriptional regulator [Iamia sp. SCSIO 61187]|uniref:TetR/AcrR family transcriptional regulator n=1 Tax=Iamia sp. SCSIO 61187 TaxID=2722752 RepID=UPI001C628A93|nr:TetR/AcrR family transcriptional regulator [Iamia sp. SCSIO 61187]QYG94072.1 TetR/AcrR family transcriptional regulator [Iamia sp. SCSIO 61187]
MSPARRSPEEVAAARAGFVDHAEAIVRRDGAAALTMRALAREAGCSVGLAYKVFADRTDLVAAVIAREMARLRDELEAVVAAAGTGTVGGNLGRWAEVLLASPAIALAHDDHGQEELDRAIEAAAGETGIVAALEATVVAYLRAEKDLGRVAADLDEGAYGFLVAGAVHNLVASGPGYPRPTRRRLAQVLDEVGRRIST